MLDHAIDFFVPFPCFCENVPPRLLFLASVVTLLSFFSSVCVKHGIFQTMVFSYLLIFVFFPIKLTSRSVLIFSVHLFPPNVSVGFSLWFRLGPVVISNRFPTPINLIAVKSSIRHPNHNILSRRLLVFLSSAVQPLFYLNFLVFFDSLSNNFDIVLLIKCLFFWRPVAFLGENCSDIMFFLPTTLSIFFLYTVSIVNRRFSDPLLLGLRDF